MASKGEIKIANILHDAGLHYEIEKTYTDCGRGKYRYDFYVPTLNILIEVDGEQHFSPNAFGRTKKEWLKASAHDRQKNSYALAHKIPLYRIPYWEFEYISTFEDIIANSHRVKNRNHNDELRRKFIE